MSDSSPRLTRILPDKSKLVINALRDSGKTAMFGKLLRQAGILLALLWLGHSAAAAVWLFVPRPIVPEPEPARAANRAVLAVGQADRRRTLDIDLLQRLPFAQAGTQVGARDSTQATITTGLSLMLKGTVPSSEPGASRAIIAEGEHQSVVHAGEPLPISTAGVSLADVFTDRVVLDNNGRAEILWMDRFKAGGEAAVQDLDTVRPVELPDEAGLQAGLPVALQSILSITPQSTGNGKIGLRLESTGNGRLFRRLGFRNDDIITGIDGVELQPAMAPAALARALQGKRSARLSILRNEQLLELDADFSLLD